MTDYTIFDGIQLRRDGVPPEQWPKLSCRQANQTALENSDLRLNADREIFFQGNGQLRASSDMLFLTGGSSLEKLRILANGNVGIGISVPTEKLEVAGKIKATELEVSGAVKATAFQGDGSALTGKVNTTGDTITGSLTIQKALTVNGNVGIGTSAPQAPLQVYSSANTTTVRIQSSRGFGAGRIEFWSDPQGSPSEWRPGFIQSIDQGNFTGGLSFCVNGTGSADKTASQEVMRLVNGNVGIGTATPQAKLDVEGNLLVKGEIHNAALSDFLKELMDKLDTLQQELQTKTTEINRINTELEATKKELQNTKTELGNTKNQLAQTTQTTQNLEGKTRYIVADNGGTSINAGKNALHIQQDGSVVVYDIASGQAIWVMHTANTALAKAQSAQDTADSAKRAADGAQYTADSALGKANAALEMLGRGPKHPL